MSQRAYKLQRHFANPVPKSSKSVSGLQQSGLHRLQEGLQGLNGLGSREGIFRGPWDMSNDA